MRALVVGWSSVEHGEATAGDVLAMRAVTDALETAGIAHDVAWSAVMRPADGLALTDADPGAYSHLVFCCGPATGTPIAQLHEAFAHATRIAVGVSVLDHDDPVTAGFHTVIPRDAPGADPHRDLASRIAPAPERVPVLGVYLTGEQGEYGSARRHESVTAVLTDWLRGLDAALLPLDTRLDPRDWRLPTGAAQVDAVLGRVDAVVSMRMHGLALALRQGVPVVAIDPVAGGGKVTAQARAWDWPALVTTEDAGTAALTAHLDWCLSEAGRAAARERAAWPAAGDVQLDRLLAALV
ncbi:polysaccharide pyruvyl transferase family protein [Tersicoccus sp. Bi-70]|uniref:polysaccharide pyruvyl transferase family protein n=1 Tax=Tersicoccus sp. Bi-70 TaxID=1897634 RepID=UPI0009FB3A46|nr:polysaccharide pyruvyl transferase family protein [Tersicoccus sp. Bi-70]